MGRYPYFHPVFSIYQFKDIQNPDIAQNQKIVIRRMHLKASALTLYTILGLDTPAYCQVVLVYLLEVQSIRVVRSNDF